MKETIWKALMKMGEWHQNESKKISGDSMGYIRLAQDRVQQPSLMSTLINIRGVTKAEEYFDRPRD
jgi:hypothetical protein